MLHHLRLQVVNAQPDCDDRGIGQGFMLGIDQLAAQREQRDAARETARLIELKAAQGAASVLERLDAQRALWAAEQSVVQVRLAELANRVALYKALGG